MTTINRGPGKRLARATLILIILAAIGAWARKAPEPTVARAGEPEKVAEPRDGGLEVRIRVETLRNPYWYEREGLEAEVRAFWDKSRWDRILKGWVEDGYNSVLYWVEPWNRHGWQTFLVRHDHDPSARDLSPQQCDRVIEHVRWIFRRGHELGLKNLMFNYSIVTTPSFAKAHQLAGLAVSSNVDFRHTLAEMGPHFGVRTEQTRAFTEAAIAELFRLYPELDGLYGAMGEAVPGKRSTWYQEAIVPGLKRSGRNPIFLVSNWMMPLPDFVQDVAPRNVYGNTWLAVHANGEMFTDAKPYPAYARWLEQGGVPAVVEVMHHNLEHGFPFNSPRLAWEINHELRKFANCRGILAWFSRDHPDWLMRKALAYYAAAAAPYSDRPWVELLEARFGDRQAAEYFLKAFDASARIIPELSSLAWAPHDLGTSRVLILPYWYWTEDDPRWSYFTSPSRGGVLLPLRYYAKVVARLGPQFRDNSGADWSKNREHPGSQELIWGLGDYPTTPEAHMRKIRLLGEESLRAAEQAMRTVKIQREQAALIHNYMRAYRDLTIYYENKVLAAIAALIYSFGGRQADRLEAERLADLAVRSYETAITFIWESIDKKNGAMQGRWLGGRTFTLPQLIEREKGERKQLPALFRWPEAVSGTSSPTGAKSGERGPSAGTFAPEAATGLPSRTKP